jgi:hypothetical protein
MGTDATTQPPALTEAHLQEIEDITAATNILQDLPISAADVERVLGKQSEARVEDLRKQARAVLAEKEEFDPEPTQVDREAYRLLHEPPPLRREDRELAARLAVEPPLIEVRRSFEARSVAEQARLLAAADTLLKVRPVIGRDAASERARQLHADARVRLAEESGVGPDAADALAARLGMTKKGGLFAGVRDTAGGSDPSDGLGTDPQGHDTPTSSTAPNGRPPGQSSPSVTDATRRRITIDDLILTYTPSGIASRAVRQAELDALERNQLAHQEFHVFLDLDRHGTPAFTTAQGGILPITPGEFTEILWGGPAGSPQKPVLHITPLTVRQLLSVTEWLYDLAALTSGPVTYVQRPGSRQVVHPLPDGYRFVGRAADALPGQRAGTLEMPGGVSGETAPLRGFHDPVEAARAWSARLVDRPSGLFAAGLRRFGDGDLRLPGLGDRPAGPREIADWFRGHGWRPGQAVQVAWSQAKQSLGPSDESLFTEVANALQTRVYAPEVTAQTFNSRDRDVIATATAYSQRPAWRAFEPPHLPTPVGEYRTDRYGRLVAADRQPAFALIGGGVAIAPAPVPFPDGLVPSPLVYDIALVLGEHGVPQVELGDGTLRDADPGEILRVIRERTAPAEPETAPPREWKKDVWSGQPVRLLVDTPEHGPRYERFTDWVDSLRLILTEERNRLAQPGEPTSVPPAGAVDVYAPEPGAGFAVREAADGEPVVVVRPREGDLGEGRAPEWARLGTEHRTDPAPALFGTDPSGELLLVDDPVIHVSNAGVLLSDTRLTLYPGLQPIELVITPTGRLALPSSSGRLLVLKAGKLAAVLRAARDVRHDGEDGAGERPLRAGLWNGSDDLQILGWPAVRRAQEEGQPDEVAQLDEAALNRLNREMKRLAESLKVDVHYLHVDRLPTPSDALLPGAAVAGGNLPEWRRVAGRDEPPRFVTNSYGVLVPETSRRIEDLGKADLGAGDVHVERFRGGLSLGPGDGKSGNTPGLPAKQHGSTVWERAAADGFFLVVAHGERDAVWLSAKDRWLTTGPQALRQVLDTAGWDGHSPLVLAVDGLAFPEDATSVPGVRFGQALADSTGVAVLVPTGKVDWDGIEAGAPSTGQGLPLMSHPGKRDHWVTYTPNPLPGLNQVEARLARLDDNTRSQVVDRARHILETIPGPAGRGWATSSAGARHEAALRVGDTLFRHGPAEAERLAAHLTAEPPPNYQTADPALLRPVDRELQTKLAAQPPLAEVQARLDALEPDYRDHLMARAEDTLARTLVIGRDQLEARNRLWDEVQLRLADALDQGAAHALALTRALGLNERGGLRGGTRQLWPTDAASGPPIPSGASDMSIGSDEFVDELPATVISAGVVAFSPRSSDTDTLQSLLPQRASVTTVLWVDHDGAPRIPGRFGTAPVTADAAALVRTLAKIQPDPYNSAEIIRVDVIGRTAHNRQAVHRLLEQIADLTQRPVWTAADRPLHIERMTLRAPVDAGHGWEQIPPPGHAPDPGRWQPRDDGQLLPDTRHPGRTLPTWHSHLLDRAEPGRVVLAATVTPAGELRIPMPDGTLLPPAAAHDLPRYLDRIAHEHDNPVTLVQLHLPHAVGPDLHPRVLRSAAVLAELLDRPVYLPSPGARSILVDSAVRLTTTPPAAAHWQLAPTGQPVTEHVTDHHGHLRPAGLPLVHTSSDPLPPHIAIETDLPLLADRPDRMIVHTAAGPDGALGRRQWDGSWQPTTPEELAREITAAEELHEPAAVLQFYVRDGIPADRYAAFVRTARKLADVTGRTVFLPPPDTMATVQAAAADIRLTAGEWQAVAPVGQTPAAFRTADGRLRPDSPPLTDVSGRQWLSDDLRLFRSDRGTASRTSMSYDELQNLVDTTADDQIHSVHVDLGPDGHPAISTLDGRLVSFPPHEFARALWAGRPPTGGVPALHVDVEPGRNAQALVAFAYALAAETGRRIAYDLKEQDDFAFADPLPSGYRYVVDTTADGAHASRGTLEVPGGVRHMTGGIAHVEKQVESFARMWANRLADRPEDLFLAVVHHAGPGDIRLPAAMDRPATADEISRWLHAHGRRSGQALQLVGQNAPGARDVDEPLMLALARALDAPVHLPGHGYIPVDNPSARDLFLTDPALHGVRGTWRTFEPPTAPNRPPTHVTDAYGRLVTPDNRPTAAFTQGGVVVAPAVLPAPTADGRVEAHSILYDVALHLGPTGVPQVRLNNGTLREADPAEIADLMMSAATPAPGHTDLAPRRPRSEPWRRQIWSGQWLRLIVDTPEPGSRHDRFQTWVQDFRTVLADRTGGRQALPEVYAPVAGARAMAGPPVRRRGLPSLRIAWADPTAHPVELAPWLERVGAVGEYSLWIGDSGAVVSAATFDWRQGTFTHHEVLSAHGLHAGRMNGEDPFQLPPLPGLLPLEFVVRHDGRLAPLGAQGPTPLTTEELVRMLRGHLWNGTDDIQVLSRFVQAPGGHVLREWGLLNTDTVRHLHEQMAALASALHTDVYLATSAGTPAQPGPPVPRHLAQAGTVVAVDPQGGSGHWQRFPGRDAPPRFTTNSYGALVPESARRIDDLANAGVNPNAVHTDRFHNGVSLTPGHTGPGSLRGGPIKPWSAPVLERAATDGEFLAVASGEADAVHLAVPGLGTWLTAGPQPLLRVLYRAGWDGRAPLRLAVDGLAFAESDRTASGEAVPGTRFGQALADLARTEVHVPSGQVDWHALRTNEALPGGPLPLQPGPSGRGTWVTYTPTTREPLPWPDLDYVESRLAKLSTDSLQALLDQARQVVEDVAGTPVSLDEEGAPGAVREAVLRVAHALRWRGAADADRLAAALVADARASFAPTYGVVHLPAGADPAATVARRLATGQPIPVSLSPHAGPGQALVRFPAGAALPAGSRTALVVADPEHFTVHTEEQAPPADVPIVQIVDAPPQYETLVRRPEGPLPSHYVRASGIISQYGRLPMPGSRSSTKHSRAVQHHVHEEVAQTLAMSGEAAAHTLARALTRQFGYQPPRGGVGGAPVPEHSPVQPVAGEPAAGRARAVRLRDLSADTKERLAEVIGRLAASSPGQSSFSLGTAAVDALRSEGLIPDHVQGTFVQPVAVRRILGQFVETNSMSAATRELTRQRYLELRAEGVGVTNAGIRAIADLRTAGVIPSRTPGSLPRPGLTQRWDRAVRVDLSRGPGHLHVKNLPPPVQERLAETILHIARSTRSANIRHIGRTAVARLRDEGVIDDSVPGSYLVARYVQRVLGRFVDAHRLIPAVRTQIRDYYLALRRAGFRTGRARVRTVTDLRDRGIIPESTLGSSLRPDQAWHWEQPAAMPQFGNPSLGAPAGRDNRILLSALSADMVERLRDTIRETAAVLGHANPSHIGAVALARLRDEGVIPDRVGGTFVDPEYARWVLGQFVDLKKLPLNSRWRVQQHYLALRAAGMDRSDAVVQAVDDMRAMGVIPPGMEGIGIKPANARWWESRAARNTAAGEGMAGPSAPVGGALSESDGGKTPMTVDAVLPEESAELAELADLIDLDGILNAARQASANTAGQPHQVAPVLDDHLHGPDESQYASAGPDDFLDLNDLQRTFVRRVRRHYLALRAAGVDRVDAALQVVVDMRAVGVIPPGMAGARIKPPTARKWDSMAARDTGPGGITARAALPAGTVLPEGDGGTLVPADSMAPAGLADGPWQDTAMNSLLGAGPSEDHLLVNTGVGPSTEVPVFAGIDELLGAFAMPADQATSPHGVPPVQDGWSAVPLAQSADGNLLHKWHQAAAASSAGLLPAWQVAAARVEEPVFVPLPPLTASDAVEALRAKLDGGQPLFGSARLDRIAAGEQVLAAFPAGSGYDLGLLGGGGADGVVVIPPGGRYQLTGAMPDYPAPGITWIQLDVDGLLGAGAEEEHQQTYPSGNPHVSPSPASIEELLNAFVMPAGVEERLAELFTEPTPEPAAVPPVHDSWPAMPPLQGDGGPPEHRRQVVAAALSQGLLPPERVAAARVSGQVFASLPPVPGREAVEVLHSWLMSGQPFFGSVHLDRVAAGGQVLAAFPAGSGYDLGLLEGGGADGVVVIPPGGRYQLTGAIPDYPEPGSTWFFLDIDPSQG